MSNTGKIVQVIGPVVDVQFSSNSMPPIYQALVVTFEVHGKTENLTLEVQQHLGGGIARSIAMSSSEGLKRGMEVTDSGSPISVPVGEGVLGRIFDVTGSYALGFALHLAAFLISAVYPIHFGIVVTHKTC